MTALREDLTLARRYPWAVALTVVLGAGLGAVVPLAGDGGWWAATTAVWVSACVVWLAVIAIASGNERGSTS